MASESVAGWLSAVCAVHCVLLPVIVSSFPALAAAQGGWHGPAEIVMVIFLIGISFAAACRGLKTHGNRATILTAGGIPVILAAGMLVGMDPVFLALVGAASAVAQFANARMCRECIDCGERHNR